MDRVCLQPVLTPSLVIIKPSIISIQRAPFSYSSTRKNPFPSSGLQNRVSRNNTLNTLEHTEHARNTPQNFCKKMKQKQHAQNTPQYFFKKLKQKQHARNTPRTRPRFFLKIKQNQHTQNTPQIFSKIRMPIDTKRNTLGSNSAAVHQLCKHHMSAI